MTKPESEFPSHLADAYAPAPLGEQGKARLASRVRERTAGRERFSFLQAAPMLGAAGAAIAVLFFLVSPAAEEPGPTPDALDWNALLTTTWEEDVLYAPEWVEARGDWLDAELVPMAYDGAALALEP